jgi:peptidoglycan/xylan/chitin deacetylase (PgdA/CDA1 family)
METDASIIIDDPLLRGNYGFLNYRKLLDLMDKHNFHTTIAFIPCNYNRTDNKTAALFRERPDRFSLCVHGCDHVKGEFGRTDTNYLGSLIKLATARMIEHEKRTGIPFDRVMVFPQGVFSNEALEALKINNYSAAVNTEAMPSTGRRSSDFPFFLRYKLADGGIDRNEPTLIVLHHDDFKNGYNKLTNFVDELNRSRNVKWDSLGNIVRHFVSSSAVNDTLPDIDLTGLKFHGYKVTFKIWGRRYASELRDNYLSKNDFLLTCAKKMKSLIKM